MRTTVQTNNARLAGTRIWEAIARQLIPLDDPEAWGNNGLEGHDEDCVIRSFKSKAAAVRWLRSQVGVLPHMNCGEVVEMEYVADEFEDVHHDEWVIDAYPIRRHVWNYWVGDDGLEPDGDWSPNES